MRKSIRRMAATFKVLGDPTRLSLLYEIHFAGQHQLAVSELAEAAGVRVATASAALRAMENNGTITSLRDGRHIYYGIESEEIHELLHWMGAPHADGHTHGD